MYVATVSDITLKDVDNMNAAGYEELIQQSLSTARPLDHTISPCDSKVFSAQTLQPVSSYVLFIDMQHETDYVTWKKVAKCMQLWDLDVRGVHRAMWRIFFKNQPLFIIGVPASPYSKYMPPAITPVRLEEQKQESNSKDT